MFFSFFYHVKNLNINQTLMIDSCTYIYYTYCILNYSLFLHIHKMSIKYAIILIYTFWLWLRNFIFESKAIVLIRYTAAGLRNIQRRIYIFFIGFITAIPLSQLRYEIILSLGSGIFPISQRGEREKVSRENLCPKRTSTRRKRGAEII